MAEAFGLFLDPSSTRTGYSLMNERDTIIEAGYFRPDRRGDPPIVRAADMAEDLRVLVSERPPLLIVVEVPTGLAGTGSRHGAGARLAIYGLAVGIIYWQARSICGRVSCVDERTWTLGIPKLKRRQMLAVVFPAYARAFARDGGGDVADAIGIGRYWLGQNKLQVAP